MKIAYFDCFSGISGDMTLGAFLDLGVSYEWLREKLYGIPLEGFEISVEAVSIQGIKASRVSIDFEDQQAHRHYADIASMIEKSPLPEPVVRNSIKVFRKVAEAESKIHNVPMENVHFHEVGGLDSIIDIVGTALCMNRLEIERVYSSALPLGHGFVECSHGTLPVPAPATLEILKDVPVQGAGVDQEMVTPTGAAIIASYADGFGEMPAMRIDGIGYGAGHRRFPDRPNLLRIMAGIADEKTKKFQMSIDAGQVDVIESCIDDMNPEWFGFLMERLFEDGALDVYLIPIIMKKNRPGTMIQVLCSESETEKIVHRILSETTTIGVRTTRTARHTLKREIVDIQTEYGRIRVKKIIGPDGDTRMVPEYDVCRNIARDKNLPIRVVYEKIAQACSK